MTIPYDHFGFSDEPLYWHGFKQRTDLEDVQKSHMYDDSKLR